jgi:hypothetical protein
MSDNIYLGNPNLKKANTQIEFGQEEIDYKNINGNC